jgi:hypothetical protein
MLYSIKTKQNVDRVALFVTGPNLSGNERDEDQYFQIQINCVVF